MYDIYTYTRNQLQADGVHTTAQVIASLSLHPLPVRLDTKTPLNDDTTHLKTMGYIVKMLCIVRALSLNFRVPVDVVSATRSLGMSLGVPVCLDAAFASSSAKVRRRESQNSCSDGEADDKLEPRVSYVMVCHGTVWYDKGWHRIVSSCLY